MGPQAIHERLRQHLVLRVGDQVAQLGATDHVRALADLPTVQEPREGDPDHAVATVEAGVSVGRFVAELGVVVSFQAGAVRLGHFPGPDALEEGVDPPEVGLLPVVGRVVMALGALDLLAQEQPRGPRGQRHGLGLHVGQDEVHGPVLFVRAGRRDQVMDDLVPGPFRAELLPEPTGQGGTIHPPTRVAAPDQQDRPLRGEILGIVGMIEQILDQFPPLVRFSSAQEGASLLNIGDPAQHVEVSTPQELLVVRRTGRLDPGLLPPFRDKAVDGRDLGWPRAPVSGRIPSNSRDYRRHAKARPPPGWSRGTHRIPPRQAIPSTRLRGPPMTTESPWLVTSRVKLPSN